jgi:hypothetical protein
MSRKHFPAAVLVSIGCTVAFMDAPRDVAARTMSCKSPMLRASRLLPFAVGFTRDKSDAARRAAPPHHMASRRRFEAIQRQIKIGRKDVKRAVKLSSLIVDISHDAGVNAGNSVKVKHRGLVDFNAL